MFDAVAQAERQDPMSNPGELTELTQRFLSAQPDETRRMLEEPGTPLLRPEAEATLRVMAAQAATYGYKDAEQFLLGVEGPSVRNRTVRNVNTAQIRAVWA